MRLTRKEYDKLVEFMEATNAQAVDLQHESGGGIGYIMSATIEHSFEGIPGKFTVELTGVEDW